MLDSIARRLGLLMIAIPGAACASSGDASHAPAPSTAVVEVGPAASAPTPPTTAPTPVAGAALRPETQARITAATGGRGTWMVQAPDFPLDTLLCVEGEIARSPSVRAAWTALDGKKILAGGASEPAIQSLVDEAAACSLAVLVWHSDIDVDIRIVKAIGGVREATGPLVLPFLIASAERLAVYVEGSEAATLHGILQQAIAASLDQLTHADVKLRSGQDPGGLQAGAATWTAAMKKLPPDFIEDMSGKHTVDPVDQACSRDDECDALLAECSNIRCVGVRVDRRSRYNAPLDCKGYTGSVANYDCQPRFRIESPRCSAGRCTSHRVPK
jgi:hypothetical protein